MLCHGKLLLNVIVFLLLALARRKRATAAEIGGMLGSLGGPVGTVIGTVIGSFVDMIICTFLCGK